MDVRFSQSARNDLRSIKEFITNNNEDAAKKVVAHIVEQVETILVHDPAIGRTGRLSGPGEFLITKYPYILPYSGTRSGNLYLENTAYIKKVGNLIL